MATPWLQGGNGAANLTVLPCGHSFDTDAQETILSAILRSGPFVRYGCRHRGCGTCKALLVDDDVDEEGSTFGSGA